MTFYDHEVTCIMCGAVHKEKFLSSYSNFHRPDLDFRPSEMGRNTMTFWLQTCPECGLVAPSVEQKRKIGKEFLKVKSTIVAEAASLNRVLRRVSLSTTS